MIPIPADLGQRILDAARIAAAMHDEPQQQGDQAARLRELTAYAGGAGRVDRREDAPPTDAISKDGAVTSRLRALGSRFR